MELLTTYLPQDRCHALARAGGLPDRCRGAVLFADVSGFTPLSELLARTYGPRRGAEELTLHLNAVYEALIHEVDALGGSVIAFAGDAITCWFDGDDGRRAAACGLAMQGDAPVCGGADGRRTGGDAGGQDCGGGGTSAAIRGGRSRRPAPGCAGRADVGTGGRGGAGGPAGRSGAG
ncbi:MAG: hypothetical protein M5U12_09175 [Verrucomicrobia bacterium]|nr:hypothetical protein [Verrucomicrobiota bacterium]